MEPLLPELVEAVSGAPKGNIDEAAFAIAPINPSTAERYEMLPHAEALPPQPARRSCCPKPPRGRVETPFGVGSPSGALRARRSRLVTASLERVPAFRVIGSRVRARPRDLAMIQTLPLADLLVGKMSALLSQCRIVV